MTISEKIEQFRKKYNRDTFINHLKEQVAKGQTFSFDVQKVIDGTETEEETQARYRLEKQAWGNTVSTRTQYPDITLFRGTLHDVNTSDIREEDDRIII